MGHLLEVLGLEYPEPGRWWMILGLEWPESHRENDDLYNNNQRLMRHQKDGNW
jgi:hypothetical protein